MTVPTHLLLGEKIYEAICAISPLAIDHRWFLYGNIYPDISHYIFSAPHFAAKSIDFVKNRIKTLCDYRVVSDAPDPIFSLQLGILCHYLCDFFCHVHSESFEGSKRGHYLYEIRQQAMLMRHPRLIGRKAVVFLGPGSEIHSSVSRILTALDEAQWAYLNAPHRADTDMILAVKFASTAVASVLNICADSAQERLLTVGVAPA